MSSAGDNLEVDDATKEAAACCASCGIAEEVDDVKLKGCDDCDLVNYCGNECKEDHRSQHEAVCRKRAAELRDTVLFKLPESNHLGDCSICCLPLPIDDKNRSLYSCCSKYVCDGCLYADKLRQSREIINVQTCPFCRHPLPKTLEDFYKTLMKRVKANDPTALREMAVDHFDKGEYVAAIEYYTRAIDLGNADAHYDLSFLYREGQGVKEDKKKELYHLEEAAIQGHPFARHNLGCYENMSGEIVRAVTHWIIAANLGNDQSLQALKECYRDGEVSKEDFAAALRAHHATVNATKSPQRREAENVKSMMTEL